MVNFPNTYKLGSEDTQGDLQLPVWKMMKMLSDHTITAVSIVQPEQGDRNAQVNQHNGISPTNAENWGGFHRGGIKVGVMNYQVQR